MKKSTTISYTITGKDSILFYGYPFSYDGKKAKHSKVGNYYYIKIQKNGLSIKNRKK